MPKPLKPTTDATFDADVLASDRPVLVDFTASWCAPCKLITPVLEQIAEEQVDRLTVLTLDVDANPRMAMKYQVMGMPTMILFRNADVVTQIRGAKPRTAIMRDLEPHLRSD